MKLIVNTDGGARGNPGPAGIGVVVRVNQEEILKQVQDDNVDTKDDKLEIIHECSEYIGEATNNQAEYRALIKALEWVVENKKEKILRLTPQNDGVNAQDDIEEIEFRLDSELVVKQINGEYKMKNKGLKPLFAEVKNLIDSIGAKCVFVHVRREKNKEADALVNKAIDAALGLS